MLIVIGLTGGVASGKSTVAEELTKLGAVALNADRIGHEMLQTDEVIAKLSDRWGDGIVSEGAIDRRALAELVFGDSDEAEANRKFLELTLHPRIRAELVRRCGEASREGKPAVVLDVPLLVEVAWTDLCEVVLFVNAPLETRLARAMTRGWSEEEFARREAAQMPVEEKRKAATFVIENGGPRAETTKQIAAIWDRLQVLRGEP